MNYIEQQMCTLRPLPNLLALRVINARKHSVPTTHLPAKPLPLQCSVPPPLVMIIAHLPFVWSLAVSLVVMSKSVSGF